MARATNGYRRPYPSSGCEYSRPHTTLARYASEEARKTPTQVWVRCCNKMHPVRIDANGRVQVPAHRNLKAERMITKMGGKEPRCLQILRLWKGDKVKKDSHGYDAYDPRFHQKLQKYLPDELLKAYCGGLKHRDSEGRENKRHRVVTPVLRNELTWYPSADLEDENYWLKEALPQMAMERLLVRELMNTPRVVQVLKGRGLRARSISFTPKEKAQDQERYYGDTIDLDIRWLSWYSDHKEPNLGLCGNIDRTFVTLAASGQNRLKNGDLIIGKYAIGSNRYKERQDRINEGRDGWNGPGAIYVKEGKNDIYIALTIYHNDVKDRDELIESEEGVIGEGGNWLCLKSTT